MSEYEPKTTEETLDPTRVGFRALDRLHLFAELFKESGHPDIANYIQMEVGIAQEAFRMVAAPVLPVGATND